MRRKKVVESLVAFLRREAQTEAEPGTAAGEDWRVVWGMRTALRFEQGCVSLTEYRSGAAGAR